MKRAFGSVLGTLVCILLASPGEARGKPTKNVSPGDLWLQGSSPTVAGWVHKGCVEFADPEGIVNKGPISKITVHQGAYIHGIQLWYGKDGIGNRAGIAEDLPVAEWTVPDGEGIVRVEGGISKHYVSRLQFFTDGGHSSPQFGGLRGKPFVVSDPSGGTLRTISGWANLRKHPSLNRALASMTFHFGAPYFIKEIDYDEAALEKARLDTAPEQCADQDIENITSVEQSSAYTQAVTVTKTTKVTFEQSYGLKLGATTFVEGTVGLIKAGAELSWEASATMTAGRTYSNSREETVSWSLPVKVPPHTKVLARSTWRKYRVSIPFTYTVAWYEGTRDNIKKEVTLPGLYEDVRVDDLKHVFKEARLD